MIRMFLNKHIIFGLILLGFSSMVLTGCVKNPDTGEQQPDYPTIAQATQITVQSLVFAGLKHIYQNHPEDLNFVYSNFQTSISVINSFTDGSISVGDVVVDLKDILKQVNDKFNKVDPDMFTLVSSMVDSLSSLLQNIVLTAVHENGVLILNGFATGVNEGLVQYNSWVSTLQPVALIQ